MPAEPVRSTNDWMAAVRAEEHARPDPYLDDPFARLLTGPEPGALLRELRALDAPIDIVIVRGRFGDERLRAALGDGVRQIVSLAAGTDARGWRLPLPPGTVMYEIDLPGQLALKHTALGPAPNTVLALDADLRGEWTPRLAAAGHDASRPTAWIIEGLLYYLDPPSADRLLAALSGISAPGSSLQLDVPDPGYFTDPRDVAFVAYCVERGSPFTGWSADPVAWLSRHGWRAEGYLPEGLDGCGWLPEVPGRLRTYRNVWHVAGWR